MPTRTARTEWHGGLQDGSGKVTLSSSGLGTYDMSFPRRSADDADGVTSPEELIAAAHSACFSMQFSAMLVDAGAEVSSLETTAEVGLGPDRPAGFRLTGIALTVRGRVDGVDEEKFREVASSAKAACPVSKALTGVDITLDAAFA